MPYLKMYYRNTFILLKIVISLLVIKNDLLSAVKTPSSHAKILPFAVLMMEL